MSSYFNQRTFQGIIQTTILPWAQSGSLQLAVAEPGWPAPAGIRITPEKGEPLASTRFYGSAKRDVPWKEMGLHLLPYPLLVFILDGEADLRIGHASKKETVVKGRTRQVRGQSEVSVFALPVKSCLIVPPDVAHSDGSIPHWERPMPEDARSQILWIRILPTGAVIHICRTEGLLHTHASSLFVRDLQLAPMTQFLLERAKKLPQTGSLLASFVLTIILCLKSSGEGGRTLESNMIDFADDRPQNQEGAFIANNVKAEAFERACFFIDSHLTDALSPAQIARNTHISVAQLSRLFHAQLNIPVMKYVTQRRLEEARALLLQTTMTAQEIGENCGYPHPTHFSRVFKEYFGSSPRAFRHQAASRK